MLTEAELTAYEQAVNAATPGPWRWNLNLKSRSISLEALISGFEVVMDRRSM